MRTHTHTHKVEDKYLDYQKVFWGYSLNWLLERVQKIKLRGIFFFPSLRGMWKELTALGRKRRTRRRCVFTEDKEESRGRKRVRREGRTTSQITQRKSLLHLSWWWNSLLNFLFYAGTIAIKATITHQAVIKQIGHFGMMNEMLWFWPFCKPQHAWLIISD